MKENLTVVVKAGLSYDVRKGPNEIYTLPDDYNYEPVLDYIKRFSLLFYGIPCDPKIEDLKYVGTKSYDSSHFVYDWVDTPDYSYGDRLWNLVEECGWNRGIAYTPMPIRPSNSLNEPKEGYKPSWGSRHEGNVYVLGNYERLVQLYEEICNPPTRI